MLFQYSFEVPKEPPPSSPSRDNTVTMTHSFAAQLPVGGVVSLSRDTAEDVGPLLNPVHNLGVFKAGELAVCGERKLAAIVSSVWQFSSLPSCLPLSSSLLLPSPPPLPNTAIVQWQEDAAF